METIRSQFFKAALLQLATLLPYGLNAVATSIQNVQTTEQFKQYKAIPQLTSCNFPQQQIDYYALQYYPDDAPRNFVTLHATGNGNCLYNAVSTVICGNESMASELRLRAVISLVNMYYNVQQDHYRNVMQDHMSKYVQFSGTPHLLTTGIYTIHDIQTFIEEEMKQTVQDNKWSGITQLHALATALDMPLLSIYPSHNVQIRHLFNKLILPWSTCTTNTHIIPIMWTGYINQANWFVVNHFVPVISSTRIIQALTWATDATHMKKRTTAQHTTLGHKKLKTNTYTTKNNDIVQEKQYKIQSEFYCIDKLPSDHCTDCKVLVTGRTYKHGNSLLCIMCNKYNKKNTHSPLHASNLYPGDIPQALSVLNSTELQLISKIHPYMTLLKLPVGGQYAQRGQSINFPVPIQELSNQLPRTLDKILLFDAKRKHSGFVHTNKVHNALQWLQCHNVHYHNITIQDIHYNENSGNTNIENQDDQLFSYQQVSLIPDDYVLPGELPTYRLPFMPGSPINVFTDASIEALAFPRLFPYGYNTYMDLTDHITLQQYFTCRMFNKDRRWSKCMPYLFWSLNIYEQHRLQSSISIALRIKEKGTQVTAKDVLTKSHINVAEDYKFMKSIKGTGAYWKDQLFNLLSKMRLLGAPTFFISLSSNDSHWLELYKFINPSLTQTELENLSASQKNILLSENPVYSALYFSRRWENFLRSYLLGKKKPLGNITDHFARVEFQNRGSPHIHAFLWVDGAPDMETTEGRKQAVSFIDKYICAALPENNDELKHLVQTLQSHKHTHTCSKSSHSTVCRFDFPRPTSETTSVEISNISTTTGRFYKLKRPENSTWINPYNANILSTWKANMDIQVVGCKRAAAVYVCTYVCKNEPVSLREQLSQTIQKLPEDASTRKKLSKIGNILLTHRVISSQEATYRLFNMHMVYSSRTTVFINSCPPSKQHRRLKSKKQLTDMPEDSTDIFTENIHDIYKRRPSELHHICLARFATNYVKIYKSEAKKIHAKKGQPRHKLLGTPETYIRQREKPAAFRTYIPQQSTHPEGHFYSLICLFYPWQSEVEIQGHYQSTAQAFEHKYMDMDKEFIQQYHYSQEFEKAVQQVRMLHEDIYNDIQSQIAPNFYTATHPEIDEHPQEVPNIFSFADHDPPIDNKTSAKQTTYTSDEFKSLSQFTMTDEEYTQTKHSLSLQQTSILEYIANSYDKSENIHLFITGGAGTGKSYLLKITREHLLRENRHDYPNVLVSAPTGVAAFNVTGWTLHTLLHLDVTHDKYAPYTKLSDKKLSQLRPIFRHVKVLIIDEISMVSIQMLIHIHLRLTQIFDTQQMANVYFGGLSVIAFGDLYQLKPVFGSPVFSNHPDLPTKHLWKDLFLMVKLDQNYRQAQDNTYALLLNRIRTGSHSSDDIKILQSRKQTTSSNTIQHIFPTIAKCTKHNEHCIYSLLNRTCHIVICNAIDDPPSEDISTKSSDCAGLHKQLQLCLGTKVMLLRNIQTSKGLVNGAQGTVTGFQYTNGTDQSTAGELPHAVRVLFDDPQVGRLFTHGDHEPINICPITAAFRTKNTKETINRTQLPLAVSFGVTVHKVQGQTLQKASIDIGDSVFQGGMAYVALSRVSTLDGLSIIELNPMKLYPPHNVTTAMQNMKALTL